MRGTMRLGSSSPSCSGFEAEPLCWLQHGANRWQQDWHSQENPSCGGQRAAGRERSGQTEGENGAVVRGEGAGTSYPPPQAQPPPQAMPALPLHVSACIHIAASAQPSHGAQDPSRVLRAHLARSPTPKALTGHLPSPFILLPIPSSQLTSLAYASWAAWHRGTPEHLEWTSSSRNDKSMLLAGFLALSGWGAPNTHWSIQ